MSRKPKLGKNKRKGQRVTPDKRHVARTPASAAEYKKKFLENLEHAPTPTRAAKIAFVARSTVYKWKNEDPEFSAAWDQALMVGVERVERAMFERAIKDSDSNCQFIMRAHKPEIYGRRHTTPAPTNDETARLSLEEAKQILLQLGYAPPIIEGDYEEVDAAPTGTDHS